MREYNHYRAMGGKNKNNIKITEQTYEDVRYIRVVPANLPPLHKNTSVIFLRQIYAVTPDNKIVSKNVKISGPKSNPVWPGFITALVDGNRVHQLESEKRALGWASDYIDTTSAGNLSREDTRENTIEVDLGKEYKLAYVVLESSALVNNGSSYNIEILNGERRLVRVTPAIPFKKSKYYSYTKNRTTRVEMLHPIVFPLNKSFVYFKNLRKPVRDPIPPYPWYSFPSDTDPNLPEYKTPNKALLEKVRKKFNVLVELNKEIQRRYKREIETKAGAKYYIQTAENHKVLKNQFETLLDSRNKLDEKIDDYATVGNDQINTEKTNIIDQMKSKWWLFLAIAFGMITYAYVVVPDYMKNMVKLLSWMLIILVTLIITYFIGSYAAFVVWVVALLAIAIYLMYKIQNF